MSTGKVQKVLFPIPLSELNESACLCRMNPHDRLKIVLAEARQNWRAFAYVMQVHENHYTKRAGVAGIRARATG
ncbi:hypothetical protein GZA99_001564 [Salmonella enterica]|nr:hypothetical protein [Salmonella enterica]EGQ2544320.1 hypothetical protein [Salmonella enterica]